MSTNINQASASQNAPAVDKTPFEQQRDALVSEIAVSLDHVLQNINKLNRGLEGIIAVGNEFSSVEALWSQFETVMGKAPEADEEKDSSSTVDEAVDEGNTTLTEHSEA